MLKLEKTEVVGWEAAIRGMRNPMNSWEKSDSEVKRSVLKEEEVCPGVTALVSHQCEPFIRVGPNDHELMMKLAKGGPVHAKYRRMIEVYVDITAPLYWWKEFDTYKVGTVANSCSTMHKIHAKEFELDDFSHEKLFEQSKTYTVKPPMIESPNDSFYKYAPLDILEMTIEMLNKCREMFLETKDKRYWDQMIQLLPSSYNQKRTVMISYEVLVGIYRDRKAHKLDEWHTLCEWIEGLPYSEVITGNGNV